MVVSYTLGSNYIDFCRSRKLTSEEEKAVNKILLKLGKQLDEFGITQLVIGSL